MMTEEVNLGGTVAVQRLYEQKMHLLELENQRLDVLGDPRYWCLDRDNVFLWR
jgi:hypothetical protein